MSEFLEVTMFKKYIFVGLTFLSFGNGMLKAMEQRQNQARDLSDEIQAYSKFLKEENCLKDQITQTQQLVDNASLFNGILDLAGPPVIFIPALTCAGSLCYLYAAYLGYNAPKPGPLAQCIKSCFSVSDMFALKLENRIGSACCLFGGAFCIVITIFGIGNLNRFCRRTLDDHAEKKNELRKDKQKLALLQALKEKVPHV